FHLQFKYFSNFLIQILDILVSKLNSSYKIYPKFENAFNTKYQIFPFFPKIFVFSISGSLRNTELVNQYIPKNIIPKLAMITEIIGLKNSPSTPPIKEPIGIPKAAVLVTRVITLPIYSVSTCFRIEENMSIFSMPIEIAPTLNNKIDGMIGRNAVPIHKSPVPAKLTIINLPKSRCFNLGVIIVPIIIPKEIDAK